jgi:glutathione peroxidase-family protein
MVEKELTKDVDVFLHCAQWCAGGGDKSLEDYKGKVVLIENVASL